LLSFSAKVWEGKSESTSIKLRAMLMNLKKRVLFMFISPL
jgi:hypothetical protein